MNHVVLLVLIEAGMGTSLEVAYNIVLLLMLYPSLSSRHSLNTYDAKALNWEHGSEKVRHDPVESIFQPPRKIPWPIRLKNLENDKRNHIGLCVSSRIGFKHITNALHA